MKRKVTVLVAVVALLLIASRCDNSSSGSYSSGQYGSAMKASTGHAPSDAENDAPTKKE